MNWKTVKRKIGDLVPYEMNPRLMEQHGAKRLEKSLKKWSLVSIPIINKDNTIIGGHQRIKILAMMGKQDEEIDVRIPDRKLTKEEITELNLTDNLHTGEFDYEALKDIDVDVLLEVGFDEDTLSFVYGDEMDITEDGFNIEEAIEEITEPQSKTGAIYQLGKHYLMCGDSEKKEDVEKLLNGAKVKMVYCDPPYNIKLDYSKGISTKGKYKGGHNDKQTLENYTTFLDNTIKNALEASEKDVHVFYWCDEKYIGLLQQLYRDNKVDEKRVCLWIKNNHNMTPQIAFNKVYEPCVYGLRGKPFLNKNYHNLHEILNKEIDTGNQALDDIMDIVNIWLAKRDNSQDYQHPTQKPLNLHERPLKRCTKMGDKVLDLFGGSGSTLLSCEQLSRKAYLMEKDPVFSDVIIKRYEQFTGNKAKLIN